MKIALVLFIGVFMAYAPTTEAGTKNNPNSTLVLITDFPEPPQDIGIGFPVEFGLCAYAAPRSAKSRNSLDRAYGKAQGDEGLNKAFNFVICGHLGGTPIFDTGIDWEQYIDENGFDDDPLPNEINP